MDRVRRAAVLRTLQPHTPVFPPPPYDTMYADAPIDGKPTPLGDVSLFQTQFSSLFEAQRLTEEQVRLIRVCYHGLVAWVDTQVGLIMEQLKAQGLLDNTIIVFESDHGVSKADQGCFSKHTFAPHVQRVPRIIVRPGGEEAGTVRRDLCQSLDLARTLCGLCGVMPEPAYEGRGWPQRGCIRTQRYRLDANLRIDGRPASGEDLDVFMADTESDPAETTNLWGSPAREQIGQALLARLLTRRDSGVEAGPR